MKTLLTIAVVLGLMLLPATVFADSHSGSSDTEVTGTVHHYNKRDGKDSKVTVACDGHVKTARTDTHDNYSVKFKKEECKKDSWITVTSEHKSERGSSHRKSDGNGHCHVDVDEKPPVTEVPEFGTMATIGASLLGAGAFLVIRHRQLSVRQG